MTMHNDKLQAMAENVDKKNAWQSYYDEHKAAADRILGCEPSDYAQILGLEEPVSIQDVYKAFERLSNLLSPECSQGNPQYKLAQKAHDRMYGTRLYTTMITVF